MRSLLVLALLGGMSAQATIITFQNEDAGATSAGPFPNTDSAASLWTTFASGLGPLGGIDFESATAGSFTALSSASLGVPGVSLGPAGSSDGDDTSIETSDLGNTNGFNTTPAGSQWLYISETGDGEPDVGVVFTFLNPIHGFGARFIGVGTASGMITLEFDNGTFQSYLLDGDPGGGVQFFGFVDTNLSNLITSVTVRASPDGSGFNDDAIGIDDVVFVGTVPEPSTVLLSLVGLAGIGLGSLRRRKRR